MVSVLTNLDAISTGYNIFEKDQVLTHDQLNSVAEYAEDQIRLTRVRLLGVGNVCGLRVSLSGSNVTVTKGVGVTTDGDLISLDADTVFDRFKAYDKSYPAYRKLYVGGDLNAAMIPAFQLVAVGKEDTRGIGLGSFAAQSGGKVLGNMTALLLMESHAHDDDLCSGTDCDNLGQKAVNTLKLILVDKNDVGPLRESMATPGQAFALLPEVVADRPAIPSNLTDAATLATKYRTACTNIHNKLTTALPAIRTACSAFLGDLVGPTTATGWTSQLTTHKNTFASATTGIQYYYDFLKDVVDTYNEFREHLFLDSTWCVPAIDSFPKHLLLGDLTPGTTPDANRTGFYPSPLTGKAAGEQDQARFLIKRLEALITHFSVNTSASQTVRVTPSAFEDRPVDERAIPFYYTAGGTDPIQKRWSYRLVKRGADASTYSYNGSTWAGATNPATTNPLAFSIGRFPFFRVEGHIGKAVSTALTDIQNLVNASNLPFTVRAVLLSAPAASPPAVVKKQPGRRITDFHHLHNVVRNDMTQRLKEAEDFSTRFQELVLDGIDNRNIPDPAEDYDGIVVRSVATSKGPAVRTSGAAARSNLSGGYSTYSQNAPAYQVSYGAAVQAAADFKYQASPVVKTEFSSPFDTLISSTQTYWLPWIDQVIHWKEQKEDERLLFTKFADKHPQIEHFGGVLRGGTLVLVHNTDNVVIADFMLPYHWEEEPVEAEEPALTVPDYRPPVIIKDPVRIIPSRITLIDKEWTRRKPELGDIDEWKKDMDKWMLDQTQLFHQQFEEQSQYFHSKLDEQTRNLHDDLIKQDDSLTNKLNWQGQIFKDSVDVLLNFGSGVTMPGTNVANAYDDKVLGSFVQETKGLTDKVTTLRDQLEKTTDSKVRSFLTKQLADTEKALSTNITQTTEYMSIANADVTPGGEGFGAALQVTSGLNALSGNTTVHTGAVAGVNNVMANTQNTALKMVFGAALGH